MAEIKDMEQEAPESTVPKQSETEEETSSELQAEKASKEAPEKAPLDTRIKLSEEPEKEPSGKMAKFKKLLKFSNSKKTKEKESKELKKDKPEAADILKQETKEISKEVSGVALKEGLKEQKGQEDQKEHKSKKDQKAKKSDKKRKKLSRRTRRRIIRWTIILLILAGGGFAAMKYLNQQPTEIEQEVIRDIVDYGSITSVIENSGLTKARNNENITVPSTGTVMEVQVAEGDEVAAGSLLFTIDSPTAKEAVEQAQKSVRDIQKQLADKQKDIAEEQKGLTLAAKYSGKLLETVKLNPGDQINKGDKVAVLADDTRMRLTQYYSYAYEGQFYEGQTVDVSIPALTSNIPGTVEAIHMVHRIVPEGSNLFAVDILIQNDGALSVDMEATASLELNTEAGTEMIYPYEAGKLSYYRTGDLCAEASGEIISSNLIDFLQVSNGQTLVQIKGEDHESEISDIQRSLSDANKELSDAQETLDKCHATAPIGGTVIGLAIKAGDEVNAGTAALTISDTSSIIVTADVDERNIGFIKPGMEVELNQWDTPGIGQVESVSLSSTVNNGVATYPVTIAVDNSEGVFQINSYTDYKIIASQSENCLVLPLQSVRTVSLEDGSVANVVFVEGERPENALDLPEGTLEEEIPTGFWPVQVEIGISDNYNVEIKSGVEQGTTVFTQMQQSSGFSGMMMG